jgi:hypothetical protein
MAAARYCGLRSHGPLKRRTMKNPVVTAENRMSNIDLLARRHIVPHMAQGSVKAGTKFLDTVLVTARSN